MPSEGERKLPDRNDKEHLAYVVARLVCEKGWSTNTIARNLFPDEYDSNKQSQANMRVKRALRHAISRGILQINPPADQELEQKLRKRFDYVDFHVVHDDPKTDDVIGDNPVCRRAAKWISGEIHRLVSEKPHGDIVIANAGGLTVSSVVHYLQAEAAVDDGEAKRLKFISLNAACKADRLDLSANFNAVRMAEIYGGKHLTSIPMCPQHVRDELEEAIRNIDLLISSAGTLNSFLFLWHKEVFDPENRQVLPDETVGDITFIPVDDDGCEVELPEDFKKHVEDHIVPRPRYEDLLSLAGRGKVLVICARLPSAMHEPGADYGPDARARVAKAILQRGLASRCILGTTVARGVLRGA